MPFIVGRMRRPDRRPHAADLPSDRSDHSDASAACVGRMRRPQCVGRNVADYAPTLIIFLILFISANTVNTVLPNDSDFNQYLLVL